MTIQITKRIMFVSLALFQCMIALAQLGDPREKLSITASVDGATNTDYRRESEDGQLMENGRLRQGVNTRLQIGLKLQMKYSIK